jgi:transglutaminase-like putative cysteine protease
MKSAFSHDFRPRTPMVVALMTLAGAVSAHAQTAPPAWASAQAAARASLDRNPPAAGRVIAEPTRRIDAHLAFRVEVPQLQPTLWVAFAAVPPTLAGQRIESFHVTPQTLEVADLRLPTRKLTLTALSGVEVERSHTLDVSSHHRVQLFRRTFLEGPAPQNPSTANPGVPVPELAQALVPTETLDFDTPSFQAKLTDRALRPKPTENDLAFVRRVFTTLKGDLRYEYHPDLDRRSSQVWPAGKSDCSGINGLLVSVLRANGIPARTLCGRWARSAVPGETLGGVPYGQWHVKAEVYLRGVGWVPADLSGAVQRDAPGDGLAFFGHDDGNFLVMHTDFDLRIDTMGFGRRSVRTDQGFVYWVRGSGAMDGRVVHETWEVHDAKPAG